MDREELLNSIDGNMVDLAIKKNMKLFLILLGAAAVPEGKWACQSIIRELIGNVQAKKMMSQNSISNAANSGYLERMPTKRLKPEDSYGHIPSRAQGVYRISKNGMERLETYFNDLRNVEIKPRIISAESDKEILISLLQTIENAIREARLKIMSRE